MASKFPTPGQVFEETYKIEAILGSGGFARVYRAIEVGLQRPVALKILRPPARDDDSDSQRDNYLETLMERFQREALMLSKLRSSYTVNLFKYGKTDDGLLYMALEYIDGLSLAELLRAGKPLPAARVAKILRQVLMSLQEAHELGMLHRDLKPANIMVYEHLGERDHVKLLDFGIAKLVTENPGEHKRDLTSDGTLIGTPRYMAPEQIQGTDIGPPSDIYALGLVCFELLTGERAIKGDSSIQIIGKQLAPQSFKVPEGDAVPPRLRHIVDKMMEKRVDMRFQSCDEVLEELQHPGLLSVEEIPEIVLGPIQTMEDLVLDEISDVESLESPEPLGTRENLLEDDLRRTRTRQFAVLAVLLLAALGGIIAIATSGPEPADDKVVTKPVKTAKKVVEPPPEKKPEPEIKVTARLDGGDLDGVTVLVDGVEKGVTPLTLTASEIRDAKITARYKLPDVDKTLEDVQAVTDPRDVLFEFDKLVGELIPPPTDEVKKPVKPAPVKKRRKRRKPPRKKPDNIYVAPE